MNRRALRPHSVRNSITALLATLTLMGCADLTGGVSAPRAPGPFDPGQSALPAAEEIEALCGGRVTRGLSGLTESYFAVALEWDRYLVYVDGVKSGAVTPEEYAGADQRHRSIRQLLATYRESAESVRYAGGRVTGTAAAQCDKSVMVVFEKAYQSKQPEIDYVEAESKRLAETLRRRAGVPAE
jgi:hypothetical protein